jgi:hypothetical protein
VELTEHECDLLLSLLTIELDVEELLQNTEVKNGTVEIVLPPEELDFLLGTVAFEANHTENRKLQKQLDALYEKLDILLAGE